MTQRELASATGVAQSTVARIELGRMDPRTTLLDALLRACGEELEGVERLSDGVDRSLIQASLALTPLERIEANRSWVKATARLARGARR